MQGSSVLLLPEWHFINGNLVGPGANLRSADLSEVNLVGANLAKVDFYGAYLIDSDLTGTILTGAILKFTDLSGADLTSADLTGANLTDSIYDDTTIGLLGSVIQALSREYALPEIADLRPGSTMVEVIGGQATIDMRLEQSGDLIDWADTGETMSVTIPGPDANVKWFRFAGPE